jgi:hypothetical protein
MSGAPEGLKMRAILWLAGKLPPCEAITRLSSESMERPLTARERAQKRLHFLICVWCERYERQLRLIREVAREPNPDAPDAVLSGESRERMKRALRGRERAE